MNIIITIAGPHMCMGEKSITADLRPQYNQIVDTHDHGLTDESHSCILHGNMMIDDAVALSVHRSCLPLCLYFDFMRFYIMNVIFHTVNWSERDTIFLSCHRVTRDRRAPWDLQGQKVKRYMTTLICCP